MIAFVGVRGVVSLAAALAIPLATAAGAPFPYRDLILFITFGVILVTLVGQGLLLPSVVRWLGLARDSADERQREHEAELAARAEALNVAQSRLDQLAAEGQIPPEVLAMLRARHDYRVGRLPSDTGGRARGRLCCGGAQGGADRRRAGVHLRLLREGRITDEARRRIERELDLEEASIAARKKVAWNSRSKSRSALTGLVIRNANASALGLDAHEARSRWRRGTMRLAIMVWTAWPSRLSVVVRTSPRLGFVREGRPPRSRP